MHIHPGKEERMNMPTIFSGSAFRMEANFQRLLDEKVLFAQKRQNQRPRTCLNIIKPEMVFSKLSDVALGT